MIFQPKTTAEIGAWWTWERLSKSGQVLGVERAHNLVPTEGLNALLDIMFHGATQIGTWYILLFSSDHTPVAADTYAVPGFVEYQGYNEATRPEFVEVVAAAGATSNGASRAIFTMSMENLIYGSALVGGGAAANTKGDVAGGGTLFSSVRMGSPQVYTIGEAVRVTVNLSVVSS